MSASRDAGVPFDTSIVNCDSLLILSEAYKSEMSPAGVDMLVIIVLLRFL